MRTEEELRELLRQKAHEVSDDATIPPRVVSRARAQRVLTATVASLVLVTASFGAVAAYKTVMDGSDIRPISSPPPTVEADPQGFVAVHRQSFVGGTHKLWVREEGGTLCVRHTFPGNEFLIRQCAPIPPPPEKARIMIVPVEDQVVMLLHAPTNLQQAVVDLKAGGRVNLAEVDVPPDIERQVRVMTTTLPGDSIGCVRAHFPGGIVEEPLLDDSGKQLMDTSEEEDLARAGCI